MKHNKPGKLMTPEVYDIIDDYDYADYDDAYYDDLLEEKAESKWRKRPSRAKRREEDFYDTSSDY